MSYQVSLDMSNVAKRVFEGLDVSSSAITSLSAFRTITQAMNKACIESRKRMEVERAEMLKTYSQGVVTEKIQELNAQYNEKISGIKEKLRAKLNDILTAKQDAISKYTVLPPSDEQMRLLQSLQMRGNDVSDIEWSMIVRKCADNYQALSIIQSIAEKAKRPFVMPFSPDEDMKKVETVRAKFESAIANIDKEPSTYETMELLNYGQDQESVTTELIKSLDSTVSSSTPLSYADQLKEARDNALHVGNYDLFNTIHSFIWENLDALNTAVPSAEIREVADRLIKAGMNATESKKTPYEAHRDRTISKLEETLGKKQDEQ